MAYLAELLRPRCRTCNALAVVELVNRYNAKAGTYCKRHGTQELKAMQAREGESLPSNTWASTSGPFDSKTSK